MNTNETENKRYVSILLTELNDGFSIVFKTLCNNIYTHSSIGIDDYPGQFFSFNMKRGFCIETLAKKKKDAACMLYRIEVSEESYQYVKAYIETLIVDSSMYKYSYVGILLCLLHIPHHIQNQYFCSQFVAELLRDSGAMVPRKKPSVYLPKHFAKEPLLSLQYTGTIKELATMA